jgi:hypothetical protein
MTVILIRRFHVVIWNFQSIKNISWNGRDIKMSRKDFWLLLPSVRSTLYPNCSGGYVSSDEIFEGRFRAVPILSSTHQADWQLMAPHCGAAAASALTAPPPHNIYPWSTFKFLLIIDESKKGWWTDARRYVRHARHLALVSTCWESRHSLGPTV